MSAPVSRKDTTSLAVICGLLDLTSLEGMDTQRSITALCEKALRLNERFPFLDKIASVCVFPVFVAAAKTTLNGSGIRVAAVTGGFPHGQSELKIKLQETQLAIGEGADEIDFVFSRGRFLDGDLDFVKEELMAVKDISNGRTLKVILETGELETSENITLASKLALESGADFIKTSTGKSKTGATILAVDCMTKAILNYREKTSTTPGLKISGGVSDIKTAAGYIAQVEALLGKEFIRSGTLRFGASRLLEDIQSTLYKG